MFSGIIENKDMGIMQKMFVK
jgi:hypothetical protein